MILCGTRRFPVALRGARGTMRRMCLMTILRCMLLPHALRGTTAYCLLLLVVHHLLGVLSGGLHFLVRRATA